MAWLERSAFLCVVIHSRFRLMFSKVTIVLKLLSEVKLAEGLVLQISTDLGPPQNY